MSLAGVEWDRMRVLRLEEIAQRVDGIDHSSLEYYSVARARANGQDLVELRSAVTAAARKYGYPGLVSSRQKVEFDQNVAGILHNMMRLLPNDAATNEVWIYINTRLLPDILLWRHGSWRTDISGWTVSADRLFDITRTTFGRLWWRAEMLGIESAARLGEDECVQLMERPRVVGIEALAKSIVEHHLSRKESGQRMELLREVAKMLTRRLAVVSVVALRKREIDAFVLKVFQECEQALLTVGKA